MKKLTQIVAAVLSVITVFAFTSCRRENQDQTIDKNKLQLYVKYYNGGFGDEWLKKLGSEFEAMYDGYDFGGGKVGVQIFPEYTRGQLTGPSSMKGNRNNVYLLENKIGRAHV